MAGAVRLSSAHLRDLFERQTGTRLGYFRDVRIKKARELFENSFLTVNEVATQVGINDVSHFVHDFGKAYGITPARYRQAHQPGGSAVVRENPQNRYGILILAQSALFLGPLKNSTLGSSMHWAAEQNG